MNRFLLLLLCTLLTLSGCSSSQTMPEDEKLHILATTYPIYLFTRTLTEGVDGVEVTQLIDETVSCLHDYTLTVPDMKAIERADVIILNGAEFETFMEDALAQTGAVSIDCSEGIHLLPAAGHEHHDHGDDHHHGHYDPHYWLSTEAGQVMLNNILQGLSELDPNNAETYRDNFSTAAKLFPGEKMDLSSLSCPYLITFHDGFHYLADTYDLNILKSIEEESGREASAAELIYICDLIEEHNLTAIFVEKNSSLSAAEIISAETGTELFYLNMAMTGDYFEAMYQNIEALKEALG